MAFGVGIVADMALAPNFSRAAFDPSRVTAEAPEVARRFIAPGIVYPTPGFAEDRKDFTSHAEVFGFLDALASRSARVLIEGVGRSQEGRAMALVILSGQRGVDPALPTVLVLAQQHGNEPAGGEAALAIAQLLAERRSELLERVNVLLMPRANPDGAEHFRRTTSSEIDVNRDHLLLRTPEAQAIARVLERYRPQVVLDLHEFTVAGRWVDKFGAVMRADALLQAASVGNLSPAVVRIQSRYLTSMRSALEGASLRASDYHTTSSNPQDLKVSMGGVNVDIGRNVGGLRNAVSLLIETRGVGLGRAHFPRRVHAHVLAAMAVIESAAQEGEALIRSLREAGEATAQAACNGEIDIAVAQTPQRRVLNFLDAGSGEPRDIEVDWRASDPLKITRSRSRPCGYLIESSQTDALERLRALGVQMTRVDENSSALAWGLEHYVIEEEKQGARQDGRGAIADGRPIRILSVRTEAMSVPPSVGAWFVPMAQPLAGLISAALEPDSQNSFAANHQLGIDGAKLLRVMESPRSFQSR